MVTSFRDFISSRDQKNAFYSPVAARRKQLAGVTGRSEAIYQPDPDQPSFQESDEGRRYQARLREIDQESEFIPPEIRGRAAFHLRNRKQTAKTKALGEFRGEYDARIKQGKSLGEATFTNLEGRPFDPERDTPSNFILPDKQKFVSELIESEVNKPQAERAAKYEAEAIYFQQLLTRNGVSSGAVPPNPDGTPNWNEKVNRYKKQAYEMLEPISIAPSSNPEETKIRGYQKRELEKQTGMSRLGSFAGTISNPLNEEFLPIATSQSLFAMPGFIAKETGLATPAVAENMMKVGATGGEYLGFGVGIGSVARGARWMAEDVMLPFLVVRGSRRLLAKKFGQKGIRKAAQLDSLVTNADAAAPSVELTLAELPEAGQAPLVYARGTVGGTLKEADSVSYSTVEGKLDEVILTRGNATTTYKINTVDDWYNAAGDATGMSKESVEQAKKVSTPVLKALADFHGVSPDDYIKALSPEIRGLPRTIDGKYVGRGWAGQTTPGGVDAAPSIMQSTFRKVASLVEFVQQSPGLAITQADSFVTLQHELAHIILEDVFAYNRQLGLVDNGNLADLSKSLKDQILIRAELTGIGLSQEQATLLKSLSVEEVGKLLASETPARLLAGQQPGTERFVRDLLGGDLSALLHEAGADLFAKYTLEVATGVRPAANAAKTAGRYEESASVWNSAARALAESWKMLKMTQDPQGIALAGTLGEQKIVNNFTEILEQITESTLSGKAPVNKLAPEQAKALAIVHAKQTVDPNDPAMMLLAAHLHKGKWVTVQQHGAKVEFDLSAARSIVTDSTVVFTNFGQSILHQTHYEDILKKITKKIDFDQYSHEDTERLRWALTFTSTSPQNKLLSVTDVAPDVRSRLELVDPNIPNMQKRLDDSAFVNEAGQPIVFFHGAAVDFDKNFDHMQTNIFSNVMGPGNYNTDFDHPALSYAIDRFRDSPSQSPMGARVQASHILVPEDKVMSMESVGLYDRIGARFIDGVLSNPKHTKFKQLVLTTRARITKKSLSKPTYGQFQSPELIAMERVGRNLAKSAENLDLTVANISELFGERALQDSYDLFGEEVEHILRAQSGYMAPESAVGPAPWDAGYADENDFAEMLSFFHTGLEDPDGAYGRILAEAAVTTSRKQVAIELDNLRQAGKTPSPEQLQAFKNLEKQDEAIQEAVHILDARLDMDLTYKDLPGLELTHLARDVQVSVSSPYLWQMAKSSTLRQLTPKVPEAHKNGVDFATFVIHSKRNREFIRDIQDTYGQLSLWEDPILFPKANEWALEGLNARYAEHNIEAVTEIGGAVLGGVPHRVVALVGSNEVINGNRAFVKIKTKGYARSVQPIDNKVMDGAPYEVIGKQEGYNKAVYSVDAYKGTRLRPVKPVGGNFKGGEQKTYEFSRADLADESKSTPIALVSIHRVQKVSPKQSKRTGAPVETGTNWVMHTKPLGGGADLTLAERQQISDKILDAPFGYIKRRTGKLRRVSAIDINTTFRERQIMSDIAAREPSSDEARAYYREKNPKGGDIDDTVSIGELESSPTGFGRTLGDGVEGIEALNAKGIEEAIDKKLVASPRAVERPARASAEILDMQRKTEQGLVMPSYHRKAATNLTPAQIDYRKYFGRGISDPVNKIELDFVLTDTTGVYRGSNGQLTLEGNAYISDRLTPKIQEIIDGEEYKAFRQQRDTDIAEARTRGTAVIEKAEDAYDAGRITFAQLEKQKKLGLKMTKSAAASGFKPLKLHPIEVQALLNTGFERLKDIPATAGQKKVIRAFDRDGYSDAIKKLIGVDTPRPGSPQEIALAKAAPRLKGVAGTQALDVGEVLTPHEVQFIWEALGLETKARSITPKTKLQILRDIFTQLFNFPRTLLLSADLGAIWNQGGLLIGGAVKPVTTRRSLAALAKGDLKAWYRSPDTLFYRNLANSMHGMFSAGNYRGQMRAITQDADYTYLTQKTNIHISDIDGPLTQREEVFLGNIFNSVGNVLPETLRRNPFMQKVGKGFRVTGAVVGYPFKAGERFHTLYLNKMRYELLSDYNKGLRASGIPEAKRVEAINSYADFLNKATGRGNLGPLDSLAPQLSAVLLAPRWMASRFQVPFTVAKVFGKEALGAMPKRFPKGGDRAGAQKRARAYAKKLGTDEVVPIIETGDNFVVKGYNGAHTSKQISADLARSLGVISGIVGLLAMNGFKVETDWRKSSHLKVSKGRLNIDLTMGLGSVWRFMARAGYGIKTGKEVSGSGVEFEADVMRQIGNFSRAKASPLGASAVGVITGENYYGEEVSGVATFIPGQSTDYEDFLPLMIQQIKDASEQMDGGFTKTLVGAGAVGGLNVGIYPDKDDLANELAGIPYKELYGYEQKYINRMYYEGTEFEPSEYTRKSFELEVQQYEFVETIMSGGLPNGEKASRIYRHMDRQDAVLHGLRLAYFGEDRNSDEELSSLKQAQNEYYEMLEGINTPEQQALLTDEDLEKIKDKFLGRLSPMERDYILANKTNFMVPPSVYNLIKPNHKASVDHEAKKADLRLGIIARGGRIPDNLKEIPINELSDKYYAVARNVIESNLARERLTKGRVVLPSAEEQIEISRSLLAR